MKSKVFKSSVFLLALVMLFSMLVTGASAAQFVTSGDFTYYVNGNYAVVYRYNGSAEVVSVPSKIGAATVIGISDKAFWAKKEMKAILFPATIQAIGKASFNECTGLTKVVLPANLRTIGESAFWYCTELDAIYIPPSVTSIAANTFTGCSKLTAYVIPSTYAESYAKTNPNVNLGYRFATGIKFALTTASLAVGVTARLKYTVSPANVFNGNAVFTSSDTSVATVNAYGYITGHKCGTTIITATTADGSNKKAQMVVNVIPGVIPAPEQTGSSADGFTIQWQKSAGATAYAVCQYNEITKKWVLVQRTTSLSYTVTGLKAGSYGLYCVLPYTIINGKYRNGIASATLKAGVLSPGKVSNVEVKGSTDSIQLTWDAAPNAVGYQLYRYNEVTSSYSYVGKYEGLTATVKNLSPNTKYIFAIRAYMIHQGSTILSPEVVNNIVAYTTPSAVSSFAVDSHSITTSGARLIWDKLKGVSGYELYLYDENAQTKYTLVAKLPHEAITGYTIDSLKAGQSNQYCIRAYIESDVTIYGPLSPVVNLQPATLPESHAEAFETFISALNASKVASDDFYFISTEEVSNLSGTHTETFKDVLDSIAHTNVSKYYFEDGIEKNTALPIGNFIKPYNIDTSLKFTDIRGCEFKPDGNGYNITVTLGEEQLPAAINSQIAPVIDWGVIAGQYKGFSINYCLYEGTVIKAKVQNGRIDDMTIIMPINYSFTYGGSSYTFAETITHNYIFGW